MHENGHGFDKVGMASKFLNTFELIEPPYWNPGSTPVKLNIYYCTTGRAIWGNIQLEGGNIGPTEVVQ